MFMKRIPWSQIRTVLVSLVWGMGKHAFLVYILLFLLALCIAFVSSWYASLVVLRQEAEKPSAQFRSDILNQLNTIWGERAQLREKISEQGRKNIFISPASGLTP